MKKLIIAEKPDLSRTIQRALYFEKWKVYDGYSEGENYICTHCYGHLFQLWDLDDYYNRPANTQWSIEELPFIPKEYKYKIKELKDEKKQFNIISNLINRNDVVLIVNAGDADSEGQRLVNQTIEFSFKKNGIKKPVKRLWFSDQNESSIRKDINNLKNNEDYINYDNEANARMKIDWDIGINYSRALSCIASDVSNTRVTLPQGRVLGTIVKYIYDRYKEQENFIPENYFNISFKINDDSNLNLVVSDSLFKENEQYKALELMNELNRSNTYVSEIKREEKNKYPHNLFSLTTLQNKVSKEHKISSKITKDVVQSLYEKGYVSYPRTNTEYLSSGSKEKVKRILGEFQKLYKNLEFKDTSHIFDDKKVSKTSHEAIIPTEKIPDNLSGTENLIYTIIRNRFISNFCTEECLIEESKMIISNSSNSHICKIKGVKVIKKGYLVYDGKVEEKELPEYLEGEKINGIYQINDCVTKAPSNVTLTELNNFLSSPFSKSDDTEDEMYEKMLSGLQIGTVATRADIIENAINYKYIDEQKGVYTITKKGIYYIEISESLGLIMTKEQNAAIGKYLMALLENKISVEQCVGVIEREVIKKVNNAKTIKVNGFVEDKEEIGKCPLCGSKVVEGSKSFYCEKFKEEECIFIVSKLDKFLYDKGKTLTKQMMKSILKSKFAKITGFTRPDGSKYDATIKLVQNDKYFNVRFADKDEIKIKDYGTCPRCSRKILEGPKSYYCSGYKEDPKCFYTIWKENKFLLDKGIKIKGSQLKKLIKGENIIVKDIKRKDGKGTYDAEISLIDTGTYVNFNMNIIPSVKH